MDLDLADVTIIRPDGSNSVVHTTQNHPFWNATSQAWTDAAKLRPGDHLRTPDGGLVEVASVYSWTESKVMLNLSVSDLHTYDVVVLGTPVLVHNMPADPDARGRGANLPPDTNAVGDHTVFERDENGRVRRYQTWYKNDRNPNGWDKGPRFRGDGGPHSGMEPPLYYEKGGGKAVPDTGSQLPRGYGVGGC